MWRKRRKRRYDGTILNMSISDTRTFIRSKKRKSMNNNIKKRACKRPERVMYAGSVSANPENLLNRAKRLATPREQIKHGETKKKVRCRNPRDA